MKEIPPPQRLPRSARPLPPALDRERSPPSCCPPRLNAQTRVLAAWDRVRDTHARVRVTSHYSRAVRNVRVAQNLFCFDHSPAAGAPPAVLALHRRTRESAPPGRVHLSRCCHGAGCGCVLLFCLVLAGHMCHLAGSAARRHVHACPSSSPTCTCKHNDNNSI